MINKQRKLTVSVLNGIILLIICVLQFSPYAFYKIYTAVPVFAVGFICAVSAYFGEWQGAAWGAVAGVCMDSMSAGSVCFNTFTLMAVGLICGLLMTNLLNQNIRARIVLCFVASAVYFILDWFFNYFVTGKEHLIFLFKHALPSFIYTALVGVLFILLYSFINNRTGSSKS